MALWLLHAGLLHELAKELVLKLWMGQADLQGALSQRDVVVDGRSVDSDVDEKLTGLGATDMLENKVFMVVKLEEKCVNH